MLPHAEERADTHPPSESRSQQRRAGAGTDAPTRERGSEQGCESSSAGRFPAPVHASLTRLIS